MKKLLYFLLFFLSCALLSCSSVDDDEEDLPAKKRLVAYKTPSTIYEFEYNSQGYLNYYFEAIANSGEKMMETKFIYENNKLVQVNIRAHTSNDFEDLEITVIYHTDNIIYLKEEYIGDDNFTLIDTLNVNPTNNLLEITFDNYHKPSTIGTFTYDNSGNIINRKWNAPGYISEETHTYDAKPSPFSTLTGPPYWYWERIRYGSAHNDLYSSKNNRIKTTRLNDTGNVSSEYRYDYDANNYPVKGYYKNNNGYEGEYEYIYEEY